METPTPQHLTAADLEQLFADARRQAEAQRLAAHLNHVRAAAALAAGEAEIQRLITTAREAE
jgi:hypothetical protein